MGGQLMTTTTMELGHGYLANSRCWQWRQQIARLRVLD